MAEEKKKKPIGKIIAVVAVVLVIVALFGSGSESKDYSADSSETATDVSQEGSSENASSEQDSAAVKYAVTDEVLDTSDPYFAYIKGTLANNSGKDLSYIGVEYVLYDADGAQIGTAYANTSSLKADGIWKFEAAILDDVESVASYELADVTAW